MHEILVNSTKIKVHKSVCSVLKKSYKGNIIARFGQNLNPCQEYFAFVGILTAVGDVLMKG